MSAKPRTTPKDLVLSVPLARRPGARPADCREPYRQFESGSVFLRYQGLAGGAGSLERTRLRFQPKITCYCGFLMYLGPSWPRSCRFFVMIQRFNSFAGAIGNT